MPGSNDFIERKCINCTCRSDMFNLLNEEQLELIYKNKNTVTFKRGETIRKQGTAMTHVISVNSGAARGLIYMEHGVLKHAILGKLRGEEALLGMLRLPGSQVHFKEGSYPNLPANVKLPWDEFMATLLKLGEQGGTAP